MSNPTQVLQAQPGYQPWMAKEVIALHVDGGKAAGTTLYGYRIHGDKHLYTAADAAHVVRDLGA